MKNDYQHKKLENFLASVSKKILELVNRIPFPSSLLTLSTAPLGEACCHVTGALRQPCGEAQVVSKETWALHPQPRERTICEQDFPTPVKPSDGGSSGRQLGNYLIGDQNLSQNHPQSHFWIPILRNCEIINRFFKLSVL